MTKRNILAEADKFLVKGEVTELPLTMDKNCCPLQLAAVFLSAFRKNT